MPVDLHGYTIHSAWREYRKATQDCYYKGVKKLQVITGHGVMQREFLGWVDADPYAISAARLDPNKGAWTVYIKRKENKPKPKPIEQLNLKELYKHFNKNS